MLFGGYYAAILAPERTQSQKYKNCNVEHGRGYSIESFLTTKNCEKINLQGTLKARTFPLTCIRIRFLKLCLSAHGGQNINDNFRRYA
jgi:hypothetical protein